MTAYSTEGVALHTAPGAEGPLGAAVARLMEWQRGGARLVLVAAGGAPRSAAGAPRGHEWRRTRAAALPGRSAPGRAADRARRRAQRGAWLPADGLVLVTEGEIFGEPRQVRRARRERAGDFLSTLAELKPDDYVVHVDHGIGLYRGLRHMQVAGTEGDYLHLEYLGGDRLYLPVDRINLVQRYMSGDGAAPSLDKLGGNVVGARQGEDAASRCSPWRTSWSQIYAAREAHGRGALRRARRRSTASSWRASPSRRRRTSSAPSTTCSPTCGAKPMDRLVCGDVGFGKTEVAMRAALLVVLAGRQVAVLVPTTVLAQQHLETFRARFAGYPVVVEMVSRFRSAAENKATLARLAEGKNRRRDRHAPPPPEGRRVQAPRAPGRRRGASLRRALDIDYHRDGAIELGVNDVRVLISVETRDFEHGERVVELIRSAGYPAERL